MPWTSAQGVDALAAEKLLIVRGLRLLRLVRALRMINHFKAIGFDFAAFAPSEHAIVEVAVVIDVSDARGHVNVVLDTLAPPSPLKDPYEQKALATPWPCCGRFTLLFILLDFRVVACAVS